MADVAGLGIRIDSTEAKKGADEVIRALQGILGEARKTTAQVDETGNSFEKLKKGGGVLQTLKEHWLALSIGVTGAFMAIKKGWDLLKAEGAEQAMERGLDMLLSKYKITSAGIVKELQAASNGIISRDQAIAMSARGLAMSLDPSTLVQYAKTVERVSQVMGADFQAAMEGIETAAATGMPRAVKKMLAIFPDFTKAIDEYAAKMNIHKDLMTEEENVQARMTHLLDLLKKKYESLPPTMQSVYLEQQRMIAAWADMKDTLDGKLLAAVTRIYGITDKWGALLAGVAAGGVAFMALKMAAAAVNAYRMAAGVAAVDAVLKALNLTMLKSPIFLIAAVLGIAIGAWYRHNQVVEEARLKQEEYNVSLATMPKGQMDAERVGIEKKLRDLDATISKLQKVRDEEEKRENLRIRPQGTQKGTGMEWKMEGGGFVVGVSVQRRS